MLNCWVPVEQVELQDRKEYCVLRVGLNDVGTWYADTGWACTGDEWDAGRAPVSHILNGAPLPGFDQVHCRVHRASDNKSEDIVTDAMIEAGVNLFWSELGGSNNRENLGIGIEEYLTKIYLEMHRIAER